LRKTRIKEKEQQSLGSGSIKRRAKDGASKRGKSLGSPARGRERSEGAKKSAANRASARRGENRMRKKNCYGA